MQKTEQRVEKIKKVLSGRQPGLTVVLENVHDKHNVSAVLRSCDAVGILDVCLVYYGENKYPEELGASSSASARKWVGTNRFDGIAECYEWLRGRGMKIYSTHMSKSSVPLYSLDLARPVALVFGNEHTGLSDEAVTLADGNFLIPQAGMIQSLNISVACAVSLYEAYRQRMMAGMYDSPQLAGADYEARLEEWLHK